MSAPSRKCSQESADSLRKRVCKACDRCRLKKSKCDGSTPCSRCKADNAICVFGERKKSHDKVYPKGYVEMLEQQQSQLVAGLIHCYSRLVTANAWPGEKLSEAEGHPLTHDILTRLDILRTKASGEPEAFEEDTEKLQQRLVSAGAPFLPRRGSLSSDSDRSNSHQHQHQHHGHKRSRSYAASPVRSPVVAASKHPFRKSFDLRLPTRKRSSNMSSPASTTTQAHPTVKPSPLHAESPVLVNANDNFMTQFDQDVLNPTWELQSLNGAGVLAQTDSPLPFDFAQELAHDAAPGLSNEMQEAAYAEWQRYDQQQMPYGASMHNSFPSGLTPGRYQAQDMDLDGWEHHEPIMFDAGKYTQVAT